MKKILSIFAVTTVFAACNSNPKTGNDTSASVRAADTASANHNAFTDTASEVQLNGVSDTIVSNDGSTYVKVTPKEEETTPVKHGTVSKKKSTVGHTSTPTRSASSAGSGAGTTNSENSTVSNSTPDTGKSGTETSPTTTTETKKKGWSKAAKGTVIGAGTGAAAGAIISKKKGKGAIIGGIIGATGGYIIGRGQDKKDGRYLQDTTKF